MLKILSINTLEYLSNFNHLIMKTSVLITVMLCAVGNVYGQETNDEKEALAAVVEERVAWGNRDLDTYRNFWVQNESAHVYRIYPGGEEYFDGWSAIEKIATDFFKESPEPESEDQKENLSNIKVFVHKNVATVHADFNYKDGTSGRKQINLVKEKGKWKIFDMYHVINPPRMYMGQEMTLSEWNINWAGYEFLEDGKYEEAIEILELNTRLFPESPNVWDSLGEAYMTAGNEMAIDYYSKSLELFPDNEHAKNMIAEMKKKSSD